MKPRPLALEIEEVRALFADDAIVLPGYTVYRATDSMDARWYYRPDTDRFYVSVTTFISKVLAIAYGLLEWIKREGKDADRQRDEAAGYGTFMHTIFSDFLRLGQIDLDDVQARAEAESRQNSVYGRSIMTRGTYETRIGRDIVGFAEFCRAHSVKPLLIEGILTSEEMGTGGALDLLCQMNIGSGRNGAFLKKDGAGERIVALMDWKSGKSVGESAALQLHCYKRMANENFPEIRIDRLFNYQPTDWTANPGWKLTDQTDSKYAVKIDRLLSLFHEFNDGPSPKLTTGGILKLGAPTDDAYSFEDIRTELARRAAAPDVFKDLDEIDELLDAPDTAR